MLQRFYMKTNLWSVEITEHNEANSQWNLTYKI